MKKNKMMRIASVLLIAVMMTTCAISGTFAKYVTSETGTDSARVAKFGVEVIGNGSAFASSYETDDVDVKNAGIITHSVVALNNTDKLVAPGTSGDMVEVDIKGRPEVAVKVTYDADFDISSNWTVDGNAFYCPLVICVEGTYVKGIDYTTEADFEAAVEGLINSWSKTYAPNTDLANIDAGDAISVSWEWPFSTGDENDKKDTWLGNQAAAGNPATVTLTVETTVTQID